jgi:hypothetical protein
MVAEKIFYMLFSVLILLVILHFLSKMLEEDKDEPSKVVLVPGFNNLFNRPFFRRRSYLHGLPWVGPRVGGYFVGPFGRRFRRYHRR